MVEKYLETIVGPKSLELSPTPELVSSTRCTLRIWLLFSGTEITGLSGNLYYYIKHLRIGGSIFCHGKFLLYPFYPSIRRIIFIVG
jgi:hypothetical protein